MWWSENSNSKGGGMGFTALLQLLFIGLKLCKVIDWSWFWVLCPSWISFAILIILTVWMVSHL